MYLKIPYGQSQLRSLSIGGVRAVLVVVVKALVSCHPETFVLVLYIYKWPRSPMINQEQNHIPLAVYNVSTYMIPVVTHY